MKWQISVPTKDELVPIESKKELTNILLKIHKDLNDKSELIELVSPNKDLLVIGVGGELSYLNFTSKDGWPCYSSINTNFSSEKIIPFVMNGDYTEIQSRYCIEHKLAFDCAAQFFETGQRPDLVNWKED